MSARVSADAKKPVIGNGENLPDLVRVMQRLLGEGGCPWDREQTLDTLRPYVIEEAFEVVDAIDRKDISGLREELGDLLLQVVFQAELARSEGWFGPDDVVKAICEKLVRRHPHVFGDEIANTSGDVLARWEELKADEKKAKKSKEGALGSVPVALPSLLRAVRVGEKVARFGFDWPDAAGARAKVTEELAELDAALSGSNAAAVEEELGDVLFALASLARHRGVDPEAALRGTLDRFTRRFRHVEDEAREADIDLAQLSPEELDARWQRAKRAISNPGR